MRLVEDNQDDPRTESWRPAFTFNVVRDTVNEIQRVILSLDKAPDLTGMIDDFYSQQYDNGIHYIVNADKISFNVSSTKFYLDELKRLINRNEVFSFNYKIPLRSTNNRNPLYRAQKNYPNGRYIKRVTNLEQYFILVGYVDELISDLSTCRGLSNDFYHYVREVYRYLETAYDLIEKFVKESEEYKQILRDKNH